MKINLTTDQFIDQYDGSVGCVYPSNGHSSYYIGSNLGPKLQPIYLVDGELYADTTMEELAAQGWPVVEKHHGQPDWEKVRADFEEALMIKE